MSASFKETFIDLLDLSGRFDSIPQKLHALYEIRKVVIMLLFSQYFKEDLIIIDTDLQRDYPLEEIDLNLHIPHGYRVIEARNIPHADMPALLLRAKVVIDLAIPGLERLSSEGILMGAIPIISNRWNGVSEADFPFLYKVVEIKYL